MYLKEKIRENYSIRENKRNDSKRENKRKFPNAQIRKYEPRK